MEKIIIKDEMMDILRSLINSEFVSYEGTLEFVDKNFMFGNVRLNFSNKSIEIELQLEGKDFYGDIEEMVEFSCKEVDYKSKFAPYVLNTNPTIIKVGEVVKEIKIIRDYININNSQFEYKYDQAIQFITDKGSYMFCKDWCFMETLYVEKNKSYDEFNPIDKEKSFWSDEGEYSVKVQREEIVL